MTLHGLADRIASVGKIFPAMLVCVLIVWLGWRVIGDFRSGIVRVKPFEVAKSLDESGYTGAMLAERFSEKLTDIDCAVKKWKPRGASDLAPRGGGYLATIPIREDHLLGEVKVPGTEFSIDRLADLVLTALGRPVIQVIGGVVSTPTATIATLKAGDHPLQVSNVATPGACDSVCVDALVTRMAEAFYSDRKPCSLELYYYITQRRECEVAARRCAKTDPVFANDIWAISEIQQGNFHAAVDRLQQALIGAARDPKREALINTNWGYALTQLQDCTGASRKCDDAIRSDPKFPWAYLNRGWARAGMKDKREAAAMYDKAIDVADCDPAPPAAYINRALLFYDEGNFNEAAGLLRRASKKLPDNTTILSHLAYSLRHAGKNDEALAAYERVVDLEPQALYAYRGAADLMRSCHRLRAAHEVLRRALGVATADEQARLGCELADLEGQLRENHEPLLSQVEPCDSFADRYLHQGQSWTAAEPCYSHTSCLQLVADSRQRGKVYCIDKQSQESVASGLAVTTDAGGSWHSPPSSALGEKPDAWVQRIAFEAMDGALYVLRSDGAISRSLDHGATWQQISGPSPSSQPLDLALAPGSRGGLYTLRFAKVPCPRGRFHATSCARYQLFTSRDHGRSWLARGGWLQADPTTDNPAGQLWADPFGASTLYAEVTGGANNSSLRKSLDGGRTWRPLAVGSPVVTAIFHPTARGALYVAVAGDCRQVLKSTDAGESWRAANVGLPLGTDVTALAFDVATLYAGTADGGVFAMADGARTWQEVATGLPGGAPILSLAADGHGTIYAGRKDGGLYALIVSKP
jgi:tetratricopeptide (TPR) repeat protein